MILKPSVTIAAVEERENSTPVIAVKYLGSLSEVSNSYNRVITEF